MTETSEKKLFLIDAYSLIFRAYYAFINNPRVNSKGQNTSAIFGFTNSLNEILKKKTLRILQWFLIHQEAVLENNCTLNIKQTEALLPRISFLQFLI
jgi:5'-3' exonuclease